MPVARSSPGKNPKTSLRNSKIDPGSLVHGVAESLTCMDLAREAESLIRSCVIAFTSCGVETRATTKVKHLGLGLWPGPRSLSPVSQ